MLHTLRFQPTMAHWLRRRKLSCCCNQPRRLEPCKRSRSQSLWNSNGQSPNLNDRIYLASPHHNLEQLPCLWSCHNKMYTTQRASKECYPDTQWSAASSKLHHKGGHFLSRAGTKPSQQIYPCQNFLRGRLVGSIRPQRGQRKRCRSRFRLLRQRHFLRW